MSYPDIEKVDFIELISKKKEFYQYWTPERARKIDEYYKRYTLDDTGTIDPTSYQNMIVNFLNPYTIYKRILLEWDPGMGKTIASILIAMKFIEIYSKESQLGESQIGSVFIIGFTEEIFKRDLISYPKFGFVTQQDIDETQRLRQVAQSGNKDDLEKMNDHLIMLKKRLTNRSTGGFFKFFGYKALVNRLFMLKDFKKNISDMSEAEIRQSIKDGSLKWNKPLLESFRNSLVICDEIHDTYNSLEKNNWGVALQMVFDTEPSLKAVLLSGTPINNNPLEVVDIANLLNSETKLKRADIFDSSGLKPGALELIYQAFKGRTSFIQDVNTRYFAPYKFIGDKISGINYLRFTRCPMSPFHLKTYQKYYTGALAQDAQYLMDIVFPNPEDPLGDKGLGIYKTQDVKRALSFADKKWSDTWGFRMTGDVIMGTALEKSNIKMWSSKYWSLLDDIDNDMKDPKSGKMLIYHDVVHISGVLFIEQLLQSNGFIEMDQQDSSNTRCAICNSTKKDHPTINGGSLGSRDKFAITRDHDMIKKEFPDAMGVCGGNGFAVMAAAAVVAFVSWNPESSDYEIEQFYTKMKEPAVEEFILDHLSTADPTKAIILKTDNTEQTARFIDRYFTPYDSLGTATYLKREHAPLDGFDFSGLDGFASSKIHHLYKFKFDHLTDGQIKIFDLENQIVGFVKFSPVGDRIVVEAELPTQNNEFLRLAIEKYQLDKRYSSNRSFWFNNKLIYSPIKKGGSRIEHDFKPARYIVAHSDIDKSQMMKKIDRFNSPDNLWGYDCKIIIGSKIIKQSYNFQSLLKVKIMSKPANITTLIQIIGRARRKKAHIYIPPEYRQIQIKIFVSSLPSLAELSHEEQKYLEKVQDYKIIQEISKKIHEGAVDSIIARNIIKPGLPEPGEQSLGALYFKEPITISKAKKITMDTFDIYGAQMEVETLVTIIKRLFIEVSVAFLIEQLWKFVQNPPFHIEQNPQMFQYDYFLIALDTLVYQQNQNEFKPIMNSNENTLKSLLSANYDQRIMQPNGEIGYIHLFDKWLVFIPHRNSQSVIAVESPYRQWSLTKTEPINIKKYLKESNTVFNYEELKSKFTKTLKDAKLDKLSASMGNFGIQFHQAFIEETIKYVFNNWTLKNFKRTALHEFYFRMLYYYDMLGTIIWVGKSKDYIRDMYKNWITPRIDSTSATSSVSSTETSGTKSLRVSQSEYQTALKKSGTSVTKEELLKLLPVGHFMSRIPRFYHPDKDWFASPEYTQNVQEYQENDIIIGYYEKSHSQMTLKFKLRNPIHKIEKHKDVRMVEKGSMCSSKPKHELIEIAKRLKLDITEETNVLEICKKIENQLQFLELKERNSKSNIKWFYSFWETRPDQKANASS